MGARFAEGGLAFADSAAEALAVLTTLEGHVAARDVAVVLFDGRLGAAHAAVLDRTPPMLLLARRDPEGLPSAWELALLRNVMTGGTMVPSRTILRRQLILRQLPDIHAASEAAAAMVLEAGGKRNAASIAADVMHELAANALLDAPVDSAGAPSYAHQRDALPVIADRDACEVNLGVADGYIYLEATDRFGRLEPGPVARAVSSLGQQAHIRAAGGGAGLGLRRMIEHSDAMAVRVTPGAESRVVCAVNLGDARRRDSAPKSLYFWTVRG